MVDMGLSNRPGTKTHDRIIAEPPLLSAAKAPSPPRRDISAKSLKFAESRAERNAAVEHQQPRAISPWRAMPALVRVMFALDLLMGALYFLSRRLRDVIGKQLVNFFDLNGETNLPSWYSAAQLALIGALLMAFATSELRRGARAAWAMMLGGAAFLFLSLDETTSLHERFGYWLDTVRNRRHTIFHETGFWMLICAPLFIAAIALLAVGARRYLRGRPGIALKLAAGVALFIAAAAGVEALSNFAEAHGTAARALVLLEEVGEMLGATIILWGVCDLIRAHGVRMFIADDSVSL
ncbi:MAG: hypothetical protein QOE14_2949 [Humisphaera sp.]|nr:hypothetical protein [Humisphaera sp.]